jgi:TonB family protein
MSTRRSTQLALIFLTCCALAVPALAAAQDSFARAKEFYDSAAYEEALQVLGKLEASSSSTEVAAYQVFCLVALGRSAEASQAIQSIVRTDPLFRPSEAQASPRVRAFFEDVRRPLLPDVVRQTYARAKSAFDQKDMKTAGAEFDRVIGLLDELGGESDGTSDLKTLAVSFRDLTRLATPAPAPAAPAVPAPAPAAAASTPSMGEMGPVVATTTTVATTTPTGPRVYGPSDTGLTKPVAITRPLPAWQPRTPVEAKQSFRGVLEVVVDEQGRVAKATLLEPVHPTYDAVLLKAIQDWKFRPATREGVAVKYRYTADINLGPTRR